jgi:hypothetical protein
MAPPLRDARVDERRAGTAAADQQANASRRMAATGGAPTLHVESREIANLPLHHIFTLTAILA